MKRVVLGTAGHIDHGKTSLVRALTGIDTDRLREEKRRGITIELGFAHLALPDGTVAGVVDVPGHERFVRAMAAGAGGIDLVVLVVAADEGVMPQTREHLDICRLLGVPRGLVAVTKADLLPGLGADWLPLLEEEIRAATKGTFLEGSPLIPVSATTGEGLPGLVAAIGRLAAEVPERPADGPTYLPVDRAFSMKGFGTVVTGTLLSGQIAEGDEAVLLPPTPGVGPLRVRSVQVHGKATPRALAGQRTAVNLAGVEPSAIRRGQAVGAPGVIPVSSILDVELTLLAVAPKALRHRARLLLHVGTAQVAATVALLDRGPLPSPASRGGGGPGTSELAPGATAFAQLRLSEPVAALPGHRFILRGFSALEGRGRTVAGGRVLAVAAPKRRRGRADGLRQLQALAGGDPDARLEAVLETAGPAGLDLPGLVGRTALPPGRSRPGWSGSARAGRPSSSTAIGAPGSPVPWRGRSPSGSPRKSTPSTARTPSPPAWGARSCAGGSRRWWTRGSSSACSRSSPSGAVSSWRGTTSAAPATRQRRRRARAARSRRRSPGPSRRAGSRPRGSPTSPRP